MTDVLDWTGIPGCNKAWNESIMVIDEDNWEGLSDKFKLCSSLNGTIQEDVSGFISMFIDDLAGLVQYHGIFAFDIIDVCRIMAAASMGDALDRLEVINNAMRYAGKTLCFDHTYEGWLRVCFHIP